MNIAIFTILFVICSTGFVQWRMAVEEKKAKLPPEPKWNPDDSLVLQGLTFILSIVIKAISVILYVGFCYMIGWWSILFIPITIVPFKALMELK